MKRLKKGPELKMPALKAPAFLADLYYDLRDRRLLPLIALVVVAIAAVPFLLGSDPEDPAELPATPGAIAELKEEGGARVSALSVVEAKPGLRDYRKRLRGRTPTDPFRQPKPAPADLSGARLGGGEGGEKSSSSSSASTTSTSTTVEKTKDSKTTKTTTTTTTTGGADEAPSSDGDATPGGGMPTETFSFAIDVRIAQAASTGGGPPVSTEPKVRRGVRPLTPLPGEKAPAITYLGVNPQTKKPLFTVSRDVTSVFGETTCVSGAGACELLEMDPNFPVTFVYGPEEVGYRITVLKIVRLGQQSGD